MIYLMMLSNIFFSYMAYEHMIKDHSDDQIENMLPPLHRLLFPISSKGSFICTISHRILHTTTLLSSTCFNKKRAPWVHHEGSIRQPITPEWKLYYRATSMGGRDVMLR